MRPSSTAATNWSRRWRRTAGRCRWRATATREGVIDFLQVLDVQRSLLAAEQQLTDSTTTVSTDLVQIYKALGGGWETEFPDAPPAPAKDAGL